MWHLVGFDRRRRRFWEYFGVEIHFGPSSSVTSPSIIYPTVHYPVIDCKRLDGVKIVAMSEYYAVKYLTEWDAILYPPLLITQEEMPELIDDCNYCLCYYGAIHRRKRIELACELSQALELPLYIGGNYIDYDYFRSLPGQFIYVESVDIFDFMRKVRPIANLLPSAWEGFGVTVIESALTGTPTITWGACPASVALTTIPVNRIDFDCDRKALRDRAFEFVRETAEKWNEFIRSNF